MRNTNVSQKRTVRKYGLPFGATSFEQSKIPQTEMRTYEKRVTVLEFPGDNPPPNDSLTAEKFIIEGSIH